MTDSPNPFSFKIYTAKGKVARDQEYAHPDVETATEDYQLVMDEQRDAYLNDYSKLQTSLPASVYRHYDAAGVLMYVGIATDPFARDTQHIERSRWRCQSRFIRLEMFPWRHMALAVEGCAIQHENPEFNRDRKLASAVVGIAGERYVKRYSNRMIGHTHWIKSKPCKPLWGPWGADVVQIRG